MGFDPMCDFNTLPLMWQLCNVIEKISYSHYFKYTQYHNVHSVQFENVIQGIIIPLFQGSPSGTTGHHEM